MARPSRRPSPVNPRQDPILPDLAGGLAAFRRWAFSAAFPETGRIDYLDGQVEMEMSPEDLHSHGSVKTAIVVRLHALIEEPELGQVFIDSARVSSEVANLSVEPDVLAVLWRSLAAGRVRYLARPDRGPGRVPGSAEIAGGPDLVVEIVSDSSVGKDTRRLPPLYARAGVRELWLVDARGRELSFTILTLAGERYREMPTDGGGYRGSPLLGRRFRLCRLPAPFGAWRYTLEDAAAPDAPEQSTPAGEPAP